eukprot:2434918-Pyramimonas_sp.AAC.1
MVSVPGTVFWKDSALWGATVTLVCGFEITRSAFWHGSGSSRRNHQVDRGAGVPRTMCGMRQGLPTVVFQRGSSLSGNEPL